jgi:hypothetical protein
MLKRILLSFVCLGFVTGPALACTQKEYDQKLAQIDALVKKLDPEGHDDYLKELPAFSRAEAARLVKANGGNRKEACEFLGGQIGANTPPR